MINAIRSEWVLLHRFRLWTVLGAINYGRDSDSIAEMSGAILGALHGKIVPLLCKRCRHA